MSERRTDPWGEDAWGERLAGELHDGVIQWLVGAKMQAEAIRSHQRGGRSIPPQSLDALIDSLQNGLVEARRLLRGLHGPEVSGGLWHETLRRDLAQSVEAVEGQLRSGSPGLPRLRYALDADTEPVPEATAATAYRLLREAAWNALRHSQARTLLLAARRDGDALVLVASDDGRGFDRDQVPASRWGVRGMLRRAERAGGTATLETGPGQGTEYTFRLPLGQ